MWKWEEKEQPRPLFRFSGVVVGYSREDGRGGEAITKGFHKFNRVRVNFKAEQQLKEGRLKIVYLI